MDVLNVWFLSSLVALSLVSLFLANVIAGCVSRARFARIEEKCQALGRPTGASGVSPSAPPPSPIPVTIITGFLGSGKTSLLNRLLREPGGRRICVIENEAGSVSIDHALLESSSAPAAGGGGAAGAPAEVLILKNGCMCCSASGPGDELERTLDRLLQLLSNGSGGTGPGFSHVVLETSGLADPGPIIAAFSRADVATRFSMDAVVTVVDAKNIQYHMDGRGFFARSHEAAAQVALADILIVNKVDLVEEGRAEGAVGGGGGKGGEASQVHSIEAVVACLEEANPTATMIRCSQCAVDVDAVMDVGAFDAERSAIRGGLLRAQQGALA